MQKQDRTDALFLAWAEWLYSGSVANQTCPMFDDAARTGSGGSYGPLIDCIESRIDECINALASELPKQVLVLKLHYKIDSDTDNMRIKDKARHLKMGTNTYYKYLNLAKDAVISQIYE